MQLKKNCLCRDKLDDEWCLRNGSLQHHLGVWLYRDASTTPFVKNVSSKGAVLQRAPIQLWKIEADAAVTLLNEWHIIDM